MASSILKRIKTYLHFTFLKSQRYWLESWRWNKKVRDKTTISVYYGHDHIPKRGEKAGGGIIKCQDLAERFPNSVKDANILYLVSSALPHFAPIMVRLAKRQGVRLVWNQNGVAYPGWHGPGWEDFNRDMKKILHMADYVVYQSEFCKMSADRYLGEYRGPCSILYNPVDTFIFVPAPIMPPGKHLLLAGSHEHFYRVQCAIEMMVHLKEIIPEIQLTVAGRYFWRASPDAARREAEDLAKSLGVEKQVRFLGSYTQEEAIPLMQRSHILLHTKFNDPCPRLVVEAMACGLPVVFSASGGVLELVGDSAGIGVEAPVDWKRDHPPDPYLLAMAVERIFANYQELSSNARKRAVSVLHTEKWVNEHEKIFSNILR